MLFRSHVLTSARLRSVQRSEIEHLVRRPVREQAEEIAQVRPCFDLAELGAREERGEGRVYGSAIVAADEEPVLPSDGFATKRRYAARRCPPLNNANLAATTALTESTTGGRSL